ncbi:unnamed protein product [Durusdinium trenchii]|uniref:Uncharacterized protein n=1 Tax=Durusdinium trenchii TaxID=1381693 RepID=A0ABP0QZT7_9DINO
MFASAVRRDGFFQKGTARITYATKWHWIYLDQWDLPWSAEERSLLKRFKHLVPLEMSRREKDEIRRWVWQKLLPCATVKMKLSWMSRHHPLYYNEHDTMLEVVEKPFEDFLLDLAHAKPIEDTAARPVADELLHFSLMKFQDLYLDEPWWDDSDKPDEGERKIMFDHAAFFQDGTFDSRWMQRREESPLIPENGYHSSSCFTRFPEDTLGKKRYIIKKPDGWSSQMEMKVQLKHVPPLMRYTNKFKACVPLESLELPLSSSFAFMLKGSGKGEQFNYTLDRLTTMITIGVLAVQLPGPLCVMILFCLLLLASISRFYTKLTSMQDEKGTENTKHGYVPLTNEPMLSHSAAARVTSTDWVAAMGKVVAIFLEMEVFALFMQSLVLGFLAMDLIGLMSPSLCAIGCILTCVMAMIMMTLGTFRKELKKSIENISESMSQLYGVAKSYQAQAMIWLNLGSWGIDFHDFGTQNVNSVSFVVSELGVRLVGKPLVDDLLPAEEKRRQQVIKHNAYFVKGKGSNSRSGVPECAADLVRWYQDISPNFPIALSMDQLNRRKCIPSVAATLQCVNHAGRRMSHPDLDSYLTLFYPEEWEDENDNDPEAVKFLLEMWRVQVKEWMENSLGAVYSERTWTKKIQEHISALMAMPFQMSSQFVMIKVEHLLIPNAKPKMSWRKEILDRLEGKMLYVTILYDDEDFLSDLPPGRSSGYARIERLADEKKKDLIRDPRKERTSSPEADAGSEEKRPLEADLQQMGDLARFRALMEDEGDEMPDFIELEDLKHFGYWCQHQDEFKVRLPATANQFKLMVWMQRNVDGKMAEELLGISDPFDLILPEDLSSMGADEADQRRIYFYSSWTTESGRLQRIQESSKDQTENHSFFPETKRKVRDYFNPPITKSDVRETMGFVDFKVRPASQEENDEDEEALIAVRDVVAGSSELNKAKLRRHLDRQTIFAKFFGLAMEVDSSLEEHLDKLKEFRATHQSGALFLKELRMETGHKEKLEMSLLENNIRRSLWERDAMDKAIKSLEKGIAELKKKKQKNLERQKGMEAVESYRIQERWRGSFCTHETVMDFESALLLQLQTFRQGQQSDFTSICTTCSWRMM